MLYFHLHKAIRREGKIILTSLKNLLPFLIIIIVLLNCNNLNSRFSFADNQTISNITTSSSLLSSTESKDVFIKKIENTNENEKSFNSIQSFFKIRLDNIIFPIKFFSLEKNEINNIIYDKDKASLIIILNPSATNTSKLLIEIPRFILDSKTLEKKDKNFMVLIDDKPAKFQEIRQETQNSRNFSLGNEYTNNSSSRELLIDFGKDVKVIKIIGTDAVESQNIQTRNQEEKFNFLIPIFSSLLGIALAILYFIYRKGRFKFGSLYKINQKEKNKNRT